MVSDPSRVRAALYAAAWIAAIVIGPHGPVYWDSPGYVRQAITGQVGGLALGRPLFVLASHALALAYRALGGSVWALETFLRSFWLGVAALAAPLTHALARACGLSERGALLAGSAVAFSPAMAHTSDAVLTDAPSVSLALSAFLLAARAARSATSDGRCSAPALGAGAALGAAFGLREQSAAQILALALIVPVAPRGARARIGLAMTIGFVLIAAAPVVYALLGHRDYVHSIARWVRAMQRERQEHPYGLHDLLAYLGWLAALGPATLVAAAVAWTRHRREWIVRAMPHDASPSLGERDGSSDAARGLSVRWSVGFAVCVPSLLQLLLLGSYQDISYSPRYLLPALPGALAIPAGLALDRWAGESRARGNWALALLVLPIALAAPVVRMRERPLLRVLATMPASLAAVPADAVVVTGQPCTSVELVRTLAHAEPQAWHAPLPAWQTVCPGWSWPSDLSARLDRALAEGRPVVLDLRPDAWLGAGQRRAMARAESYLAAREHAWRAGRLVVWR